MKKVAILTQPLGKNYGGIIQNFALQKVLKNEGYLPVTVRRDNYEKFSLRLFLSSVKNKTYNQLLGKKRKEFKRRELDLIYSKMEDFIQKNINITERIFNTDGLSNHFHSQNYSAVIVGSDQTWRPKYSPNILNYYLDFIKSNNLITKISYASSFGTDEWEYNDREKNECTELIKLFDAVSVREDSGMDLCLKHFGMKAQLVLDPTLLLERSEYLDVFKSLIEKRAGLFTYVLDKSSIKNDFIEQVSQKLGLSIFSNQPKKSINDVSNFHSLDDYIFPSVEDWLSSFHNAEFVITDSFHGTVFSIIFNKPFISIVNSERGASRFLSLLKLFSLEDRLVSSIDLFDFEKLNDPIDYEVINKKLEDLRNNSKQFLKLALTK
ncbi:MAG: polysaccharide pyruvyl transferase [Sphingobacterium sp.]|jgi:polysaccharide pyruvyl transferase WcaK-like protein|nr:polysaccharide pyruvyl transferase [Sphingobacterium sp.]